MKKRISDIYIIIVLLLFPNILCAQQPNEKKDWTKKGIALHEVEILGKRPMKDIGVQKTQFDSIVLKENIALSMADILTFNSSIFVKSYGRATLSTVSFRGTSASHTQVTWNGMRISNPMLGMTDFSMIPAYFIDDASLLHGTSSVNEAGGGLGGLVKLSSVPSKQEGFGLQYIQGIGSFRTFDEFLRLNYGDKHWQISTRAVYQSSVNDFKYRNHDRKENVYDDQYHIISQYYPIERNRNGAFKDLHLLQEVYYNTGKGDRFGLNAWYIDSNREMPKLTSDQGDDIGYENRQREHTFRSVLSWDHTREKWKLSAKGGYIHTWMAYDYNQDVTAGKSEAMTRSRSKINTFYGQLDGEYFISDKLFLTAGVAAHQHLVYSIDRNLNKEDDKNTGVSRKNDSIVFYDRGRIELSGNVSMKWQPVERLGMSLVLRGEMFGTKWAPVIPAFFVDYLLSKRGNILAKASVTRNYRFPTLNDLYFLPGGNSKLKNESGYTYEAGLSFSIGKNDVYTLSGSASWFDQHIDNWILWLPTNRNMYYSPVNIKKVHAYGTEVQLSYAVALHRAWKLGLNGTFAWTPSINEGEPMSPADRSLGKQLPYVPEYSATLNGRLTYRSWSLLYKWCYYSERYTMTSNALTLTGHLPPYLMSNVTLEKGFSLRWADLSLKGTVNNLFDEEYLSVLSRPMPGINFEFFIGITPKWGKKKR